MKRFSRGIALVGGLVLVLASAASGAEGQHLFGPFNIKAAPDAFGFFLGDYEGLTTTTQQDQGFLPFFGVTNCKDTSCMAVGNPTGAPTGSPDPTDIVAIKVDSQGDGQQ